MPISICDGLFYCNNKENSIKMHGEQTPLKVFSICQY